MRRLLFALPLILAACGEKPAQAPPAAPAEAPAAAPAPTPMPTPAPTTEAPAAAPAPTPAPEPAAAPKAAPTPAPAATPKPAPPVAATPVADVANGQKLYLRCRSCHTLTAGGVDGIGPNLHGVFGRKAGSKAGFNYSPALAAAGFTWNASRLDSWLTDPKALVPGNKMVFPGLKDAKERADLIAYVQAETR